MISVLLNTLRCGTHWLIAGLDSLAATAAAGIIVKVAILWLEAQNERNILIQD